MKYRKKPVVIEAIEFRDSPERLCELHEFMPGTLTVSYADPLNPQIKIQTLEGVMAANVGDFIIKGVKGEFYPCKPDIFAATYEPENPAQSGLAARRINRACHRLLPSKRGQAR